MTAEKAIEKACKIKARLARKYNVDYSDITWMGKDKFIIKKNGIFIVYEWKVRKAS